MYPGNHNWMRWQLFHPNKRLLPLSFLYLLESSGHSRGPPNGSRAGALIRTTECLSPFPAPPADNTNLIPCVLRGTLSKTKQLTSFSSVSLFFGVWDYNKAVYCVHLDNKLLHSQDLSDRDLGIFSIHTGKQRHCSRHHSPGEREAAV